MSSTVCIVGVGNMGGGMARNLLARGYQVHVHDLDAVKVAFLEEKGAVPGIKPHVLAIKNIATIICVVDSQQTDDVLFGAGGLAKHMPPGHTVMLCPTIAPQDVQRLAHQLSKLGIHTIDAPMSGGPARAADGSMSLMVACADEAFTQHEKLLRDLSSKLFRISTQPGDGAKTKLVNNMLAAINLAGAAEAIALAQTLGLDTRKTLDVIEQSSAYSWIGVDRMRRALAGDYVPRAHLSLLAKDSRLALEMARSADMNPILGAQAQAIFAAAQTAGLGDSDDAALLQFNTAGPKNAK
jgi:L-threonate 2-dehydrogenase